MSTSKPRFIIVRYYFLSLWEIGAPLVLPHGSIAPDVIGGFAKHKLPRILRLLFSAVVTTSDELPAEYARILKTAKGRR
ncbi:MAG: hypothetical protein JSU96_06745 [Acidobacteriota bacterium]|nr:MAG: hypothetical protein JSU96_06745 [Acidobacteriota bacterium]